MSNLIARLEALLPLAKQYQTRKGALRRGAPTFMGHLHEQCRLNDGVLTVARKRHKGTSIGPRGFRGATTTGESSDFDLDAVTTIRGRGFLTWSRDPVALIAKLVMELGDLAGGVANEDDALEAVANMGRTELYDTAGALRRIMRQIDKLREQLAAMLDFFSRENLLGLKRWCDDPDSPGVYDIQIDADAIRVKERGRIYVVVPVESQIRLPPG